MFIRQHESLVTSALAREGAANDRESHQTENETISSGLAAAAIMSADLSQRTILSPPRSCRVIIPSKPLHQIINNRKIFSSKTFPLRHRYERKGKGREAESSWGYQEQNTTISPFFSSWHITQTGRRITRPRSSPLIP